MNRNLTRKLPAVVGMLVMLTGLIPSGLAFAAPQSVKIHEVQGSGLVSPKDGDTVVIEGIVVGDFQDGASGTSGDLNGFFVQEEDADADGDPGTSEGIFVFDGSSPAVNVAIGDLVQVEGDVSEFGGLTEIVSYPMSWLPTDSIYGVESSRTPKALSAIAHSCG